VVELNHESGTTRTVFKTSNPGPITSTAMAELFSWYNQEIDISPWPFAVSCEFVFRFLAIHPFQDGNGRLGRGLFLLSLLNCKVDVFEFVKRYLAIDRYIEKHKEEYYFALNRCSNGVFQQDPKEYNIKYFLFFMIKVLQESLQGICALKEKIQVEKNLSETAELVLKCFRDFPEIRLTTSKIIDETQLNRRTIIRNLNSLMDGKLIQKYGEGAGTRYQLTF
jgi:Fic family protein